MKEESMAERVARALFMQSVYHEYNDETLKAMWVSNASIYRAAAITAIEAMHEPILRVARSAIQYSGCPFPDIEVEIAAAIDAALSPRA